MTYIAQITETTASPSASTLPDIFATTHGFLTNNYSYNVLLTFVAPAYRILQGHNPTWPDHLSFGDKKLTHVEWHLSLGLSASAINKHHPKEK